MNTSTELNDLITKVHSLDSTITFDPNNDAVSSIDNALTRIIINVEDDNFNLSFLQSFAKNELMHFKITNKTSIGYPQFNIKGLYDMNVFFEDKLELKEEFKYNLEEYLLSNI